MMKNFANGLRFVALMLAVGVAVGLGTLFLTTANPSASAQVTAGNSISLLPASAINSSSSGAPATGLQSFQNAFILVSVTGVPVGGAPTLDVYIQASPDGGTTWRDFAHTAQITTSNVNQFVQLTGQAAGATTGLAASDAALAANTVVQGPWGDRLRVKYVFVAGGSSGSYTVSVTGTVK
jgi:hypothetical protein